MCKYIYYGKNLDLGGADSLDISDIYALQQKYKNSKYFKTRSFKYIQDNIKYFIVSKMNEILVWCAEIKKLDKETLELAAFVVECDISRSQKRKIALKLVDFAQDYANWSSKILISLTNNEKLQDLYYFKWWKELDKVLYQERREESPGVMLFGLSSGFDIIKKNT